ncbi:MAG: flagellar protein FlaG [Nitrospira sp.]|nr:flagellar protein FlaG [Nitrospira sp.]MCB9711341.1 flagellar protein FlaG [Nitrospiraceae bacterium]MDR4486341.1 flagellar protein FlaG [Nitrospirales bacterium]MCA9464495.1 flagellar protein FlaG [Nitrospira sp.]MCA9474344.1 flagellar protein FlaG [Nitrospira sp.]
MIQSVPTNPSVTDLMNAEQGLRSRSNSLPPSIPSSRSNIAIGKKNEEVETTQKPLKSSLQDPEKINKLLADVRESLKELDPRVELSLDTELNTVIVRVLDQETGDLKKQFPPEDLLELKRFLTDHSGLFVEEKA